VQQLWDSAEYALHGRFVADLAESLVELLHPRRGERILDLGCGDGYLTQRVAESGAQVLGVDNSPEMISAAKARGLDVHQLNAETMGFENEFDAVFSNAALHWMRDQNAVLRNVHRALKPGGRFVAECGGHGNIASIRVALLAVLTPRKVAPERIESNYFFSNAEYRSMLERNGFHVEQIALTPRPTPLATGIIDWLRTFRRTVLEELPAEERASVLEETARLLKPVLCDREGNWTADYVRLRFLARR
jgi:trans-aconitate methyltransferase